MSSVKEKLIEVIQSLDDDTAQKLLEELDDILLEIELQNDPEFMETIRRLEAGEEKLTPHEELLKELEEN